MTGSGLALHVLWNFYGRECDHGVGYERGDCPDCPPGLNGVRRALRRTEREGADTVERSLDLTEFEASIVEAALAEYAGVVETDAEHETANVLAKAARDLYGEDEALA